MTLAHFIKIPIKKQKIQNNKKEEKTPHQNKN